MISYISSAVSYAGSALTFASLLVENRWIGKPSISADSFPDLYGKIYIVTGGLTGIGYEVTSILVSKGAKVYVFSRNAERAEKVIAEIKAKFIGALVEFIPLDYDDLETIGLAAKKFLSLETELHGIVHNAGIVPTHDTTDETTFSVNVLGPHLFQKYLDNTLIKTAKKYPERKNEFRIVWVSSFSANTSFVSGGIDWDHIENKTPFYANKYLNRICTYSHSKAATVHQSILWNKKHPDSGGVLSISVHPGVIYTDINPGLKPLVVYIGKPPLSGALVELFALLSPHITAEKAGCHVIPWGKIGRVRPDVEKAARGLEGERLWKYIENQIAPYYQPGK